MNENVFPHFADRPDWSTGGTLGFVFLIMFLMAIVSYTVVLGDSAIPGEVPPSPGGLLWRGEW